MGLVKNGMSTDVAVRQKPKHIVTNQEKLAMVMIFDEDDDDDDDDAISGCLAKQEKIVVQNWQKEITFSFQSNTAGVINKSLVQSLLSLFNLE